MNTIDTNSQEIQDLAQKCQQWIFGQNQKGEVSSKANFEGPADRNCNLYNTETDLYFQYEEQDWGINLGWTDDASEKTAKEKTRWFFTRQNGTGKAITYGENVALGYGTHRSFLQYEVKPRGINLDWSGPPVFEWQIMGGQRGTVVNKSERVAIFNTRPDLFLVYFDRNLGGNIGWNDSARWEDTLGGKLKDWVRQQGEELVREAVVKALLA